MAEHIQFSREHHLQMYNHPDENSCDNARVVMFGKCSLPLSLTSNAPQLHMQQPHYQSMVWIHQHVTFHFFHRDNGVVKGQRETCSHPDATSHNVQKLSHADAPNDASPGNVVAITQTCTAQNRTSAEAVMCMNNER